METKQNKWLNVCNIYILLWILGYVQNLFISSSLLSLLFYIPYLLMTFYYAIKVFTNYRPKSVMLALCVFFVVLLIYGVVLLILNNAKGQDRESFLMMLFNSLGPIFPFYVFTRQGLLTEKRIRNWLLVFLLVATVGYFVNQQKALALALKDGYRYEEITNNTAYSFVGLIPLVFLLRKKPIWQYLTIIYLFFFIVSGLKRGAMLTGAVMLLWFVYVSLKITSKGKKWGIVLLTTVFLFFGYKYVVRFYENSDYFQSRVERTLENSSSNRNRIYSTLWQHYINNDNFLQLAFGEGAFHTENVTGRVKAHNDWLELLIDCGIVTVLLYLVYWICFVLDWRKSKPNPLVYAMIGSCLIFTFMRTLFSMSFSDMPFYTSLIMGYCFAQINMGKTLSQTSVEYDQSPYRW